MYKTKKKNSELVLQHCRGAKIFSLRGIRLTLPKSAPRQFAPEHCFNKYFKLKIMAVTSKYFNLFQTF